VTEPTTVHVSRVLRPDGVLADDAAETYHEASKLSRGASFRDSAGVLRLLASPELQLTATRAVRRNRQQPFVPLPEPEPLTRPLGSAIRSRRSVRAFGREPLSLSALAALLEAGYGVTGSLPLGAHAQPLRAAPSGGALYPLELYVFAPSVAGLAAGLYHYDPLAAGLELRRRGTFSIGDATPHPEVVDAAAAVVLVTAIFWRSRFKYGLRGYRFALLEAGHVVQNVLLAATSLDVGAVPIGGFFDRGLEALLDVDGLEESALYLVALGPAPR
jgi:SagB-type dehydrogenase family enzyme